MPVPGDGIGVSRSELPLSLGLSIFRRGGENPRRAGAREAKRKYVTLGQKGENSYNEDITEPTRRDIFTSARECSRAACYSVMARGPLFAIYIYRQPSLSRRRPVRLGGRVWASLLIKDHGAITTACRRYADSLGHSAPSIQREHPRARLFARMVSCGTI